MDESFLQFPNWAGMVPVRPAGSKVPVLPFTPCRELCQEKYRFTDQILFGHRSVRFCRSPISDGMLPVSPLSSLPACENLWEKMYCHTMSEEQGQWRTWPGGLNQEIPEAIWTYREASWEGGTVHYKNLRFFIVPSPSGIAVMPLNFLWKRYFEEKTRKICHRDFMLCMSNSWFGIALSFIELGFCVKF